MARAPSPLVSVVIPTLNAGAGFARLLETLVLQQFPGAVELVVIDSGSRDGTSEQARRAGATVLSIRRNRFGHGRSRNRAARLARGDFVAFTVQDALPADPHWLSRLLRPLLDEACVAGSYGLQLAPPGSSLLSRARTALWLEEHRQPRTQRLAAPEDFWRLPIEQRVELIRFDNVTSCVRRSDWQAVPFPARRFAEDMAWARTVLREGRRIAFVPEAQVLHCHERGRLYDMRRAYADGLSRVELAGETPARLETGECHALLRWSLALFRARRFDAVAGAAAAHREIEVLANRLPAARTAHAGSPSSQGGAHSGESATEQVVRAALRFAGMLTERAAELCPGGAFARGEWVPLLRFAAASLVGQRLGAQAATRVGGASALQRLQEHLLHRFLARGI